MLFGAQGFGTDVFGGLSDSVGDATLEDMDEAAFSGSSSDSTFSARP